MNKSSYAKILLVSLMIVPMWIHAIGGKRDNACLRRFNTARRARQAYYGLTDGLIQKIKIGTSLLTASATIAALKSDYGVAKAIAASIPAAGSVYFALPDYMWSPLCRTIGSWIPFTDMWRKYNRVKENANVARRLAGTGDVDMKRLTPDIERGTVLYPEDTALLDDLNEEAERHADKRVTFFRSAIRYIRSWIPFMHNQEEPAADPNATEESSVGRSYRITKEPVYAGERPLQIEQLIHELNHPEEYAQILRNPDEANQRQHYLLYGPPGTGKSTLSRVISYCTDLPILFYKGSEFVNMYVGTGAANVRAMFEEAQEAIDERDGLSAECKAEIGQARLRRIQTSDDEMQRRLANQDPQQVEEEPVPEAGVEAPQAPGEAGAIAQPEAAADREFEQPAEGEQAGHAAPAQPAEAAAEDAGYDSNDDRDQIQRRDRGQMTQEEIHELATQGPVIVFIDEIDTLAPSRTQGAASGGSQEYNQTLTELLTALEGALGHKNITVIGATNMARNHFDAAFLSRFKQVLVPAPGVAAKRQIAGAHMQAYNVTRNARLRINEILGEQDVARWTGRDIRDFVRSSSQCALQDGQMRIQRRHMEMAYEMHQAGEAQAAVHQAAAPAPVDHAVGHVAEAAAAPVPGAGAVPAPPVAQPADVQVAGVIPPAAAQPAVAPEPVAVG